MSVLLFSTGWHVGATSHGKIPREYYVWLATLKQRALTS